MESRICTHEDSKVIESRRYNATVRRDYGIIGAPVADRQDSQGTSGQN